MWDQMFQETHWEVGWRVFRPNTGLAPARGGRGKDGMKRASLCLPGGTRLTALAQLSCLNRRRREGPLPANAGLGPQQQQVGLQSTVLPTAGDQSVPFSRLLQR